MGVLAINRYICICWNRFYSRIFSIRNSIFISAFCWFAGVLVDLPFILDSNGHYYDVKSANCLWNRLANFGKTMYFAVAAIFTPCICIFLCYLRIFIYFRTVHQAATKETLKTRNNLERKEQSKAFKLARSLFFTFALFTVCWYVPLFKIISVLFATIRN